MSHTLENILAGINIVLRTIGELKRAFATRIYSSPVNPFTVGNLLFWENFLLPECLRDSIV